MKNAQCRNKIGKAYSNAASRQAHGISAKQAPEKNIHEILRLLICKKQRELQILSQIDRLLETYTPELVEFARNHTERTVTTSEVCDRNSITSVRIKMESSIRSE